MYQLYRFARKGNKKKLEYRRTIELFSEIPPLNWNYLMRYNRRTIAMVLIQGGKA